MKICKVRISGETLGSYSVSWQIEGDTVQIHHKYLLFVCVHAFIGICGTFYIFPILLSPKCHSDYNTIDGRIAANRRSYPEYKYYLFLRRLYSHSKNEWL